MTFDLLLREMQQRVPLQVIFAHIDELLVQVCQGSLEKFQLSFVEAEGCSDTLARPRDFIDKNLLAKVSAFLMKRFDVMCGGKRYALEDAFVEFFNVQGAQDDGCCDRFYLCESTDGSKVYDENKVNVREVNDGSEVKANEVNSKVLNNKNVNHHKNNRVIHIRATESIVSAGSTGYSLWEASVALLHELSRCESLRDDFNDRRVLELGAGTGLGGLAVAKLCRPLALVLTDVDTVHDSFTRPNIHLNSNMNMNMHPISSQVLYWNDLDPGLARQFDVVFGCDLVYDPEVCPILLGAIKTLLMSPDSTVKLVLLFCTLRNPQTFAEFVDKLQIVLNSFTITCSRIPETHNHIVLQSFESFRIIRIERTRSV